MKNVKFNGAVLHRDELKKVRGGGQAAADLRCKPANCLDSATTLACKVAGCKCNSIGWCLPIL